MEKRAPSKPQGPDNPSTANNNSKSQSKPSKGLFRVFTYGRPFDYAVQLVGIVAAIGSGVALALVNVVIGQFMDVFTDYSNKTLSPSQFMVQVSKFCIYFVYIGIARLVCTYIYATAFTYVAFNLTRSIRISYLRSALSQEISFFDQDKAGSISMQATSSGKLIQSGIAEKLGLVFQNVSTFVAAFIIAFVNQWKLALITSCILPALLLIIGGPSVPDAMLDAKILPIYATAGKYAESILSSVRAVKAFGLESRILDKYASCLHDARVLGNKKSPLYGVLFGGQCLVLYCGMGLAFWQGIGMVARREVDGFGTVFTVLFSVVIASTTLTSIAPHMVAFSRAATAASELFTLIDRDSSINPFSDSGLEPGEVSGVIEIQGVSFSYPTRPDTTVLDDFSLKVPAGKVTALVEPVLFNGTVFENISNGLVGTPWETASYEEQLERVKGAAKLAFADDFILTLPHGYDTRIGERGGLLSGGQKQRVAIARSIVSEPKILLLDEATSALDPHAEGIVQRTLDSASEDRTTIVIAHKLATIRNADKIVVLSKGKTVEQGRHDELVALGGAYSNLVKAQSLSVSQNKEDSDEGSEDKSVKEIGQTLSVARHNTAEAQSLLALQDRENYDLCKKTGLFHTIFKVAWSTPDMQVWYCVVIVACVVGAGVFPGQALLLASITDIFTGTSPSEMVRKGNFISLMYVVMAVGCFLGYFAMGWSTNIISQ
ncbi:Leptomycin B resistance protein pmd1, partial [Colletotrichum shisoi]